VPLGALFRRGDGWALYKVVDGRAKLTEVQVAEADPHFRAVTAGVNEGDEVIVFPSSSVADGTRTKPRKS
jgi:HlyD family secretion protein